MKIAKGLIAITPNDCSIFKITFILFLQAERITHGTEEVDADGLMTGLDDLCEDDISTPSFDAI
jgi:hypothetical protein